MERLPEIPEETVDPIVEDWVDAIAWTRHDVADIDSWFDEAIDTADDALNEWMRARQTEADLVRYLLVRLWWMRITPRELYSAVTGNPKRFSPSVIDHVWPILAPIFDALYDEGIDIEGAVSLTDPNQLPPHITIETIEAGAEYLYTNPAHEEPFTVSASQYIAARAHRVELEDAIIRQWMQTKAFPPEFRHIDWDRAAAFYYAADFIEMVLRAST